MTTWNHRVVRLTHKSPNGEEDVGYQIHEVYYDADGNVQFMTAEPVAAFGETTTELQMDLERMLAALTKPVLDYIGDRPTTVTDGKLEEWKDILMADHVGWPLPDDK